MGEERRDYDVSVEEEGCGVMEESKDVWGRGMQAVAASNDGMVLVGAFEISLLVRNLQSKRRGITLYNLEHNIPWAVLVVGNPLYKDSCDASSRWARD